MQEDTHLTSRVHGGFRPGLRAGLAVGSLALAGVALNLSAFAPTPAEAAPIEPENVASCAYAGAGDRGPLAGSLCWLDFSGFTTANSAQQYRTGDDAFHDGERTYYNVQDYPVEVEIGSGLVFTAKLDVTGEDRAKAIEARAFPTWETGVRGAFLGRNGFYVLDQNVQPALYQVVNGAPPVTTTVRLHDIQMHLNGRPIDQYSVVVADAETTDAMEQITWTTDSEHGFKLLANSGESAMGNACEATGGGFEISEDRKESTCRSDNTSQDKTGAPMLSVEAPDEPGKPWEVRQEMTGRGQQGVAFAIQTATLQGKLTLTDRYLDPSSGQADQTDFTVRVQHEGGQIWTAQTGPNGLAASTDPATLLESVADDVVSWSVEADDPAVLTEYRQSWTCQLTDQSGQVEELHSTEPPELVVEPGVNAVCTVTLTPPYLTLAKETAGTGSHGAAPEDWLLAAGQLSFGPGSVAGTTLPIKPNVSFALSEVPAGTNPNTANYQLTDLICEGRSVSDLVLPPGADTACRFTNSYRPSTLTLVKGFEDPGGVAAGAVLSPDGWTLSATQPGQTAPVVSGLAGSAAVTLQEVPLGDLVLSETASDEDDGWYSWTGLSCTNGAGHPVDATMQNGVGQITVAPQQDYTCVFQNQPLPGTLTWTKVDRDSPALLAGSRWTLHGPGQTRIEVEDCQEGSCADTVDQDPRPGAFEIPELAWGQYELVENQAPVGYQLDDTVHAIVVGPGGTDLELDPIPNAPVVGPVLPQTGGPSALAYLLVGTVLAGGSGLAYARWYSRRGRHRA